MDEAELCGRRAKAAFFDQKAQQTGRAYKPSSRWNNLETWTRIGQNCLAVEADPSDFVRAAFRSNRTPGGPYPVQLTGDAARKWYAQTVEQAGWKQGNAGKFSSPYVMEIHQLLVARMDYLLRLSPNSRRLQLKMTASNMAAWERVLLSRLAPEVMVRHCAEAKRQLAANPALKSALEELGWHEKLERLELWKNGN